RANDFAAGLDPVLFAQLIREKGPALSTLIPILIGSLLSWALISTYSAGAILSAVSRADPSRTGDYFSAGGRVFGRLLRLMLFGLPFELLLTGLAIYTAYK